MAEDEPVALTYAPQGKRRGVLHRHFSAVTITCVACSAVALAATLVVSATFYGTDSLLFRVALGTLACVAAILAWMGLSATSESRCPRCGHMVEQIAGTRGRDEYHWHYWCRCCQIKWDAESKERVY